MENRAAAVAAMHGLALGDAFGETWFFHAAEVLDTALAERRLGPGPWPWTDDTAMALSLLEILLRYGHVDQDALATAFADSYAKDPNRSYGPSMHRVLREIGAGRDWAAVTRGQFDGMGSWGNGAAMRVAPLGAWFAGDLDTVVTEAARSAAVTHAHPEAVAGAVAVAVAAANSSRRSPAGCRTARSVPACAARPGSRRTPTRGTWPACSAAATRSRHLTRSRTRSGAPPPTSTT
jgi:ADP-ribosylglycohydrolase